MQAKNAHQTQAAARGYCCDCRAEHSFDTGDALTHAHELMALLRQERRIDLSTPREQADPRLSTSTLFGSSRGKMFGVMPCQTAEGGQVLLRAFSGQYNGLWEVRGWAPPLFDVEIFDTIYKDIEPQIKELGRKIQTATPDSPHQKALLHARKELSRRWMTTIQGLYTLHNFRGQTRPLSLAFTGLGGIPTGTGDCCAPKLFHQAQKENLRPLGLAEFYWGRENASGTRLHGQFYSACAEKCAPILGFLLCGLDSPPSLRGRAK